MNNFKRVLAFLCSATLIVGSSVTAFAEDPAPTSGTTPATTTGGAGNIVAYSVETVTVPTAVKVSFNPQGWTFTKRGTGDDAVTSTDQIVSLNYGIASDATLDKKIKVSFTAVPAANATGTKDVVFVDSAEEAQAKSESNTKGAAPGEYKMYLAVAPSTAAVAAGYATDGTETAFEVDSTSKASTVTTTLLGDVKMTAATVGVQAFKDNKAEISYKLNKAVYELKDDAEITFATTDISNMFNTTTLGSVVGFTFVGAMNPNVDWTKAKVSAIAITPVYEVEDADGTETTLTGDGAPYNVIGAAAASTLALELVSATGNLRYTFPESGRPTGSLTAVTINGTSRAGAISAGNILYNASNGNFIITKTAVDNTDIGIVEGRTTVVATIGETQYTFTY